METVKKRRFERSVEKVRTYFGDKMPDNFIEDVANYMIGLKWNNHKIESYPIDIILDGFF